MESKVIIKWSGRELSAKNLVSINGEDITHMVKEVTANVECGSFPEVNLRLFITGEADIELD